METNNRVNKVCELLQKWKLEGRRLSGYYRGYGRSYLAALLVLNKNNNEIHVRYDDWFLEAYNASRSRLIENLLGPNGWAIHQIAYTQFEQNIKRKTRRARQKKMRRAFLKTVMEENPYARLENK